MKKVPSIVIILGLLLLSLPFVLAQDQKEVTSDAFKAIQNADARSLSLCFGKTVDLALPGNEGIHSRTQAEMILKDFFQANPPSEVSIKHQGSSRDGASFVIASYKSETRQFRVYFLVREGGDGLKVRQLKFDLQ